ncbi:TVP38/TMEM64 family protein [Sansalvadorimonas sp. 2012CJ34-2]|uniref:TVP38/TMEM64 family membrane protein n=1 Tax=Parendozoicomonas callyspongiae TaxID=2942213 RepID=A0ABT0PFY7_9GAMM|nr:TVP38/TMEM64 family protein [Sansalvadorimonas sp. 2012CJ34-2]MCL6270297.1 TVP38/TMEM64 family protein [Sansalvadorimonas sp. 2012CJ34-2]
MTSSQPTANKGKLIVIVSVLVIAIATLHQFGVFDYLTLDNLKAIQTWITSYGVLAPLIYIGLYIAACLFFLPGSPVTIVAAIIWGPLLGAFYSLVGASLGAACAFLVARYAARDMVEGWATNNTAFRKIDEGVSRQGWRMLMITRLVPVFPFNLQNYAYGLTGIGFWTYSLLTTLFIIPGTIAFCFMAGAISSGEGMSSETFIYLGIGAICFVGVSLLPSLLKKKGMVAESH